MTDACKKAAAQAALAHIPPDCCLGIGTGSTVEHLVDLLPTLPTAPRALVSSSQRTTARAEQHGLRCTPLSDAGRLDLYIDGADEINPYLQMIKGGGGAHTGEKILATNARRFVAIADDSKLVERLGTHPLAVEVIPLARSDVARTLAGMGARVQWREGFVTDHGNVVLDTTLLDLTDAARMERELNQIVGVVENGLFAHRAADVAVIAGTNGVRELQPKTQ